MSREAGGQGLCRALGDIPQLDSNLSVSLASMWREAETRPHRTGLQAWEVLGGRRSREAALPGTCHPMSKGASSPRQKMESWDEYTHRRTKYSNNFTNWALKGPGLSKWRGKAYRYANGPNTGADPQLLVQHDSVSGIIWSSPFSWGHRMKENSCRHVTQLVMQGLSLQM